jgi:nucleotide-binding universal stress UspA family protein
MLKSILVVLDASEYSAAAAELARQWARQYKASLAALGIIQAPAPEPVPLGASYYQQLAEKEQLAEARQRVEQCLNQFARSCGDDGLPCKLLTVVGRPYEQILWEAQRHDLIVLGRQTYFDHESHERAGETVRALLKNAPRPVVTVPRALGSGSAVAVAYDGSLQAARALQAFQALGLAGSQPVEVLTANSSSAEAARRACLAVDYLSSHQIEARPHPLVSDGSPAELILEQVRRLNARLLVMGAYGQPTLREFVLGSVTRTVIQEASVPLFLYH